MRPVNLIPAEERRGDQAPLRTGAFTYVLVGGLSVLLLAVVAMTLTGKQVSDREAEKQQLQRDLDEATARAESLRSFADFRAAQEARTATVSSLAQSRFDWERVLRELSLILPPDVTLVNLTGTVSSDVQVEEAAQVSIRDSIAGPALELVGCAPSEDSVAGFIAALEDIDGVTRVGMGSAEQLSQDTAEQQPPQAGAGTATEETDDCRSTDKIDKFELVVAFDAVPIPSTATTAPSIPAPVAPGGDDQSQVDEAQTQRAVSQAEVREGTAKADQAKENLIPGG